MRGIGPRSLGFGAGRLSLIAVAWILTGQAASPRQQGLPTDWSHRHVIFSQPSTDSQAFPCVQFPLPTGNVRKERFLDIWRYSDQMNDVRSIRLKDLTTCTSCSHVGSCTRRPGLAFMEGNMRGPSSRDCEESFARTGIPSANMLAKKPASRDLVQIRMVTANSAQPTGAIA